LSVILTNPPLWFFVVVGGPLLLYHFGGLLVSKDLLFHQLSWWFIFAKGYKKTLERYAVAYAKRFSCLRKSKEMQCLVVIIS